MAELNLKSGAVMRVDGPSISQAWIDTLTVAIIASALSLLHKGFVFGIENNVFHLPIVAGLYDEPQYRDDAFIQSLRHFSSGVWLLLSNYDKHFGQPQWLFFGLAYLSRLLSFIGFLCCASLVGIVSRRDKIVFSLILCFVAFLERDSYAGTGGLFLNYFTHSEIANGTVLLAIYFAARRRFTAATVATGVTFFINAFIAVWLLLPVAFITATVLVRRETTIGKVSSQVLMGLVPCAILAWPVLGNILGNPEFGKPIDFDFVTFLHQYFPGHVLIDSIPAEEIGGLIAVTLLGGAALYGLGPEARELRVAYCGVILLYLIGVIVPFMTSAPVVLNLHLLRSSTIIHMLGALAAAALATRWLRDDRALAFLPGCLLVLFLSAEGLTFALCIPVLISVYFARDARLDPALGRGMGYLVLVLTLSVIWPLSAWQNFKFNRLFADSVQQWTELGHWARASTPPSAIFLLPSLSDGGNPTEVLTADLILSRTSIFEFASHRRIWVDQKRGAAAMWTPSYYRTWFTRMTEIDHLRTPDERVAYAGRNGIGYVIELCDTPQMPGRMVFRTDRLCVFQAGPGL